MSGVTDLDELLRSMRPVFVPGAFVFVGAEAALPDLAAHAMVREAEGVSYVVERSVADAHSLPYDFVAAWITLQVHSDLAAVGLTAAVSAALTEVGISANVIAGRFHDHLLVPRDRVGDAMAVLDGLTHR